MSSGPQLIPVADKPERNWAPLAIAAGVVIVAAAVLIFVFGHRPDGSAVTPISAPIDAYAGNLALSSFAMSESANLAGGKLTYLDGHIRNKGSRTVTGITVQALFRNYAHEVAQNETQPLKLIRMRQPYIDVEPVSAAPLPPGAEADFRLIFDKVSPDWDTAFPELRIIHVEVK
ncbi:MAG: DUF2393 family protein [Acetobacteraceae bacterium]|nr:DUF2393 family protein [Acetobacteraceae bacterium]